MPKPDFTIPDVSQLVQILQSGKDKNKASKNVRPKKNSTSAASSLGTEPVPSTSSGAGGKSPEREAEED